MNKINNDLICPIDGSGITQQSNKCLYFKKFKYPIISGIPCLYTDINNNNRDGKKLINVKKFYTKYPFPNYNEFDDIERFIKVAKKNHLSKLLSQQLGDNKKILEIGCGTGNHTSELVDRGLHVMAIDIDPNILEIAKNKMSVDRVRSVVFRHAKIQDLNAASADVVVALFNVINYIHTESELRSLFVGAAKNLRSVGVLIFDCWNGNAVKLDPPKPMANSSIFGSSSTLTVTSEGSLSNHKRTAIINYAVELETPLGFESYGYTISSRLWTIDDLRSNLKDAGFGRIKICPWMTPEESADGSEWKLLLGAVME